MISELMRTTPTSAIEMILHQPLFDFIVKAWRLGVEGETVRLDSSKGQGIIIQES